MCLADSCNNAPFDPKQDTNQIGIKIFFEFKKNLSSGGVGSEDMADF